MGSNLKVPRSTDWANGQSRRESSSDSKLRAGLEPTTCCLQGKCSTTEPTKQRGAILMSGPTTSGEYGIRTHDLSLAKRSLYRWANSPRGLAWNRTRVWTVPNGQCYHYTTKPTCHLNDLMSGPTTRNWTETIFFAFFVFFPRFNFISIRIGLRRSHFGRFLASKPKYLFLPCRFPYRVARHYINFHMKN